MDEKLVRVKCPISGHFFGRLPDDVDLCSKMSSDCEHPDILNFQIGPCNSTDIFEKRKYRCVGNWTDLKTKNVYTFTRRDDIVSSFECFVGLLSSEYDNRIAIKEAGEGGNCYKSVDLNSFAMEMTQTGNESHLFVSFILFLIFFVAKCQGNDKPSIEIDEIFVKPTLDDLSTKYEVFDDTNNEIQPTYKPQYDVLSSNKKHHKHEDENEITDNEISASSPGINRKQILNLIILIFMYLR